LNLKTDPKRWAWVNGGHEGRSRTRATARTARSPEEWWLPSGSTRRSERDIERNAGRVNLDHPDKLINAENLEIEGDDSE